MKKIASLLCVCTMLVFGGVTQSVNAFTPQGTTPLVLTSQSFNIGRTSPVRFVVTAPQEVVSDTNVVDVQLHRRVATRDSLQSIASGAVTVSVIDTYSTTMRNIDRDAEGRLVVSVNTNNSTESANSLSFSFDGIYPVTLRIRNPQTNQVLASVLTFVNKRTEPQLTAPIATSGLVRLTAPPSINTDGQVVITQETRDKVRHFVAYLATFSAPLTIGIQPEIVSSLALSAQPEDAQLLTNLREQLRRFAVVTSTFMAADVSLFAETELDDEFIEQLRLGETTLNRYLPDIAIHRNTWIADSPLTSGGAQLLRKAGIASVLLTPAAQQNTSVAGARSIVTRTEGRSTDFMSILSVDTQIAEQLSRSSQINGAAVVAARVAAEAMMHADDLRASGETSESIRIVVSSLNGEITPGNALNQAVRALVGAQGISLVDMGTTYPVTAQTPITSLRATAPTDAQDRARQFTALRTDLVATASMTADTDIRRDSWSYLLAIGESSAISEPQIYLDALGSLLRATRESISINTPNTITLSGRNSIIRLQLRNNSATQLSVNVQLASAKLNLDTPEQLVTLSPESTTEIEVPAQALSNGRFPISVTVRTPAGNIDVIDRTTITARVNALAGYGQLVSISLLLVLAAWWWSHWRKGKLEAARAATVSS